MALELDVLCDDCKGRLTQGNEVFCADCVADYKTRLDVAEKTIEELNEKINELNDHIAREAEIHG